MEEKNSLKGFLVKKFLMVIVEIAICEFIINLLNCMDGGIEVKSCISWVAE